MLSFQNKIMPTKKRTIYVYIKCGFYTYKLNMFLQFNNAYVDNIPIVHLSCKKGYVGYLYIQQQNNNQIV